MASLHLSTTRKWLLQSPPAEFCLRHLRELLIGALKQGHVPQHVSFVMDGNRRFARSRHIETVEGHNLGFEALARILEVCYKSGIKVVSIFAFSIENFSRSKHEVDALMTLAKLKLTQLAQHGELLQRYGARIRVVGNRSLLKPDVIEVIEKIEEVTKNNGDAVLNVCFPYTSRDEITTAIRGVVEEYSHKTPEKERGFSETRIRQNIRSRKLSTGTESHLRAPSPASGAASDTDDSAVSTTSTLHPSTPPESIYPDDKPQKPKQGFRDPESITSESIEAHTFFAGLPPPELIIRTSGVERLSDYMMWQGHEDAELIFTNTMWPEFDLWTFLPILVEWQWRKRKQIRAMTAANSSRTKVA